MVVPAATAMDASTLAMDCRMITDTIISPADEPRSISNLIELFGFDYNNCNGILSAMAPSIAIAAPSSEPSSTKKRKAKSTRTKAAPSTT